MSYNLTPERLQEIAVRVVSNFMTKQADLSGSIAAEAKSLELNPEQIKRVIESSNTIAYLRQLEDAKDRAFEFPVAEYRDVMGRMVLPDTSPVVDEVKECVPMEVSADKEEVANSSVSEQEKVAMLFKETMRIKQTLTKMAGEEDIMSLRLEELSAKVQKDPKALEKLAHVCSEEILPLLSILCSLEKSAATSGSVFTNKELAEVISLDSLFKEARDLLEDIKSKQEFVKRASIVLIEKKAMIQRMDSPKSIPGAAVEGIGYGIGATARGVGSAAIGSAKLVGEGVKALAKGKTVMQRVTNAADLAGSIGVAADTKHANPVWGSIHG
jgi:hypothetical protein